MRFPLTYKSWLRSATLAAFFMTASVVLADIPIIAFFGVPTWYATPYHFKVFKEAGFDVSLFNYGNESPENIIKILDNALHSNVKLIIGGKQLDESPEKVIKRIKHHPALFGYYLTDEPRPKDIEHVKRKYNNFKKWDNSKHFYMNLLPNYGHESLQHLGIESYEQYLRTASTVGLAQISFDHYPITTDGIRPTWYENLEAVRHESLRTGKPFWGFVLSTPHAIYPQPTLASLRLQVYANLAYGAQAIQYFTYWTPGNDPEYNYYNGPIGADAKKTKTYSLVQQMNRELKAVSPLFDGAKVTSVHHLGITPQGTSKLNVMPKNLRSLKVVSSKGAIISLFTKNNHQYLAIVNKNHWDSMTVLIQTYNRTPRHVTKSLTTEPMKATYTVAAGDILLFRLS